ncbi:hypothetical protein AB1Y20_019224 [Prymnesium parvum]|uniref:HAT C-terminal dimerisation domain-containing protein n=1 Tax=Prymnesium parvum TaxID=97485 RepID=A0AB34JQP2_PRYPA
MKLTREYKGGTAKKFVLDDAEGGFWEKVTQHVQATKPILRVLRVHDSTCPTVGKVYNNFFEMGETLKTSTADAYKETMMEHHHQRWEYGSVPLIAAAYSLDPEYQKLDHGSHEEITSGFLDMADKIGILAEVRRLQALDGRFTAVWAERKKLIEKDKRKQRTYASYPDYPTKTDQVVVTFASKANTQMALFRGCKGIFARQSVMESATMMPAYLWWDRNGGSVPELQMIARLVLSQPASASLCERINSEFGFVKDRKRNRLGHDRADKLVGLFHNLRIVKNMNKINYAEPAVAWATDTDPVPCITKWGVAHFD